jgi:hypothetical protein
MKYARIVNNNVHEVFTPPVGVDISECFTAELVAQFIECPEYVEANWSYTNGEFEAPVIPADEVIIVQE